VNGFLLSSRGHSCVSSPARQREGDQRGGCHMHVHIQGESQSNVSKKTEAVFSWCCKFFGSTITLSFIFDN
jgi:hypothetical protein